MSNWSWVLFIARGEKCAHCDDLLRRRPNHLVQWQQKKWHLDCLLDRLTSPPAPIPLDETQPLDLTPWGLSPP